MNSTESFNPENQSICKFFNDPDGIFVVPEYQRQYSWTDEELEDLWTDFVDAYNAPKREDYFLGSLVVVVDKENAKQYIVDGQQRITTLMIMLNVLRKVYPNINDDKGEDVVRNVNTQVLNNLVFFNGVAKPRLQLQVRPHFDSAFKAEIVDRVDFDDISVTKSELKREDPTFKFRNTAKFFYDHFAEFVESYNKQGKDGEAMLGDFINYVLYRVFVIKISCYSQEFAIKLFLILNDRGKDLTSSDIIKTYILDKIGEDESESKVFEVNWRDIEKTCSENDIKMDEFLAFYEYYKLDSFPQKQITDDLHTVIKENSAEEISAELKRFSESVNEIYKADERSREEWSLVYSLRYIPWRVHVMSAMATAYMVRYPQLIKLLFVLRRFYYLSWIAGKTLNSIKQTSFNVIKLIAKSRPLTEIENEINAFFEDKNIIKLAKDALEDDVYGESFTKPLLFSMEYAIRDQTNRTFYRNTKEIHLDHVVPKEFNKKPKEWPGLEQEKMKPYLNKIGNMALCPAVKNQEALNYGMDRKMNIYKGKDHYRTGFIAFDTTRLIIDDYDNGGYKCGDKEINQFYIDKISSREKTLLDQIYKLFTK